MSDAPFADVRIERLEAIPLRIPMREPVKIAVGHPRTHMETVIVRLHTNTGVHGVGETQAWRRQGSGETQVGLCTVLREHFSPVIVGRSPFDMAWIMSTLERSVWHSLYAQAAISDALLDLQGKLLGVPVHALLGGKCRDRLAACAVLFMKPTVEQTVAGAVAMKDRGFRSFTAKVGIDLRKDIAQLRALREALGDDVILRVDANAGMDFDSACTLLRSIEPLGIDAAEQLLPIWDLHGLAELARRSPIPLMVDESLATDTDLISIIRQCCGTVIHTKIGKNGGIWGARKLWTIAQAAGLRIYPGNHPSTSVATLAASHLGAAWAGPLLDGAFAVGIEALAADVVEKPVAMQGNAVLVPDEPGLGVTLDERALEEFAAASL